MKKFAAMLFILGITVITIAQTNRGFLKHIEDTQRFWCRHPQLRSILIRDLLPQPDPEADYFPPSTVLARCDEHSGCCSDDKICKIADSTTVELVFMVNHMIDKTRPKHYEIIEAQNHTRCHCVNNSISD